MGWNIRTSIGPSLKVPKSVNNLMMSIDENTIVFIDEIHRMPKPSQEILYPVLEDGIAYVTIGTTPIEVKIKTSTIVGATTDIGKLADPFVDRFGLQFQLEYYKPDELAQIVEINAKKLGLMLTSEALSTVVGRSRKTPRIANRLLARILDYQVAGNLHPQDMDARWVGSLLWSKFRIDDMGLLPLDRRVLRVLDQNGGMGVDAIAATVREAESTIETKIEPYLLDLGLMSRTRGGRMITEEGRRWIRKLRLMRSA